MTCTLCELHNICMTRRVFRMAAEAGRAEGTVLYSVKNEIYEVLARSCAKYTPTKEGGREV